MATKPGKKQEETNPVEPLGVHAEDNLPLEDEAQVQVKNPVYVPSPMAANMEELETRAVANALSVAENFLTEFGYETIRRCFSGVYPQGELKETILTKLKAHVKEEAPKLVKSILS